MSFSPKIMVLCGMVALHVILGALLFAMEGGVPAYLFQESGQDSKEIIEMPTDELSHLVAAQLFFEQEFVEPNGHIYLYALANQTDLVITDNNTNSEAVSYYLLWTANSLLRSRFDRMLDFTDSNMIHPEGGYLMWRLDGHGLPQGDGANIASDADLRAIKALMIAEKRWDNPRYTVKIHQLSQGIEKVAITDDNLLAAYGGYSGTSPWTGNVVWLSYGDFEVFRYLAQTRGYPWNEVYLNMKNAVLEGQIENGLYYSELNEDRKYSSAMDGGGFSINSLWIMVRAAESGDVELRSSAQKSLDFYKNAYAKDGEIFASYASDSTPLIRAQTPWAYALVGRAAANLGDDEFTRTMFLELSTMQDMNITSPLYGSIREGSDNRISQFTMQESILTLQDLVR